MTVLPACWGWDSATLLILGLSLVVVHLYVVLLNQYAVSEPGALVVHLSLFLGFIISMLTPFPPLA